MFAEARYLTEVRSRAADWRAAFLAELNWELDDGVIYHRMSRWRDEIGLYELVERDDIDPPWLPRPPEPDCPYLGPSRGVLAWTMIERPDDARAFGVVAGAGRGVVIDRGTPVARREPPTTLDTVMHGSASFAASRLWFLPDVEAVLKYGSELLLFPDATAYLDDVREAMYRLPGAPPPRGSTWPPPRLTGYRELSLWRYTSSMLGGASYWFE